jgi:imidazolonepropionase
MWNNLWLNVNLATQTSDGNITHAAIASSKEGKIAWLGNMQDLPDTPENLATHVFEMDGEWITPGLIDCHTHLIFGGQRANEFERRLQGDSYEKILADGGGILSTVRATRETSFETLVSLALERIKWMMAHGVTTIEIKSGYGLELETELKILRVAKKLQTLLPITIKTTCLAAHVVPPEYHHQRTKYVSWIIEELFPIITKENLADAIDVFCEKIGFSLKETEQLFKAAQKFKLPIKIHAAQFSSFGAINLAAQYNALSADHLEYATEKDILAIQASGTIPVLLPGAFYFLREKQIPPINLFRQHNLPMALATDFNPGSSPVMALQSIMNLACVLWGLTPDEALKGVTINAAKALGLSLNIGSLSIGKEADLAFWTIETPTELAYYLSGISCTHLVKKGQLINFL